MRKRAAKFKAKPKGRAPAASESRRFRSNKKRVRYAGHRWDLKRDAGKFLYVERGKGRYGQWIPSACAA